MATGTILPMLGFGIAIGTIIVRIRIITLGFGSTEKPQTKNILDSGFTGIILSCVTRNKQI